MTIAWTNALEPPAAGSLGRVAADTPTDHFDGGDKTSGAAS
jgi:hypothetical protein